MKGSRSFSIDLLNVFIALVRGNRFLAPASRRVKELGYHLFQIEPSFVGRAGRVNPEAIAYSTETGHTLLVEWTSLRSPGKKKKQQIVRYEQVTREDLVDNAGIPAAGATANGTWVIVPSSAIEDFKCIVPDAEPRRIMLGSLESRDGQKVVLRYAVGGLQDRRLSEILKEEIAATRIPRGYIPVPITNLLPRDYAPAVAQQVGAFASKGHLDFDSEDVCRGLFDVWKHIALEKRRGVQRMVNSILRECARSESCSGWLVRSNENPPRWAVVIPKGRSVAAFLQRLGRAASRIAGTEYQLELFD